MAAPPARTEISDTYPNPSNAVARTGLGKLWDYATGLLGATGNAADARTALGVPSLSQVGSMSGVVSSGVNFSLVAGDAGKYVKLTASGLTVTLPLGSSVSAGTAFHFFPAAKYTLTRSGSDTITTGTVAGATSASVYGASVVIWDGSIWQVQIGGDGALIAATGYERFPSGLIMQWGTNVQTLNASSDGSITFPLAFGTYYTHTLCNGDSASTTTAPVSSGGSTTGFNFKYPAAGAIAVRTNWTAFGLA